MNCVGEIIQECTSLKFKLNEKFSALNYIFTRPGLTLPGPVQNTSKNSAIYNSVPIFGCPYVSFPTDLNMIASSRSVSPRFEIIQLFMTDHIYVVEYNVECDATLIELESAASGLNISKESNPSSGYRMLTASGTLSPILRGKGDVKLSGYS
jgi:hypothetical protein